MPRTVMPKKLFLRQMTQVVFLIKNKYLCCKCCSSQLKACPFHNSMKLLLKKRERNQNPLPTCKGNSLINPERAQK